ncbi:MAG: hypothetical protein A2X31_09645 [Elusimicrobia bacterium GWB2_63_22]|nr:MAG: hypothetical protein A2X31_09645 [Elusimicrobia bacterium GWB2_63_22]
MPDSDPLTYKNHLKRAYFVKYGEKVLAITDTSCYHLAEETALLAANLPEKGKKEAYLCFLSGLGVTKPEKIFEKLLDIGALHINVARTWKDIAGMVISPKLRLIGPQLQEKVLGSIGVGAAGLKRSAGALCWLSFPGLIWGIALLFSGPGASQASPSGNASGLAVLLLVIASSLLHELGHSFAAAASGIGFRPIGFSVYLIYPVFYTNVSGIDKLDLKAKAFIDCGGFIPQSIFLFFLLMVSSAFGSAAAAEAARWIVYIVLFNLNPLLRTDGYWLYKDIYAELKASPWARAMHYLYLSAFFVFSVYFLWFIYSRLGGFWGELKILARSPEYLFQGGYRILLGAYFIFLGLTGGLRRFKEGRKEWDELRRS